MFRACGVHKNVRVNQNHGIERACGVDSSSTSLGVPTESAKAERALTAARRIGSATLVFCFSARADGARTKRR